MISKPWALAGAVVLLAAAITGGVVALSGGKQTTSAAEERPVDTASVERGTLSDVVSLDGTLTYRSRSDGSPYAVINQARGVYTELPDAGDKVDCGDVFYRVDEHPVLLLCGAVPTYRELRIGDQGTDVRQLNQNLHRLGYGVGVDPDGHDFTEKTETALEMLQHDKGLRESGDLAFGEAVFLPESMRVAKVAGELGGTARPGGEVAQTTSDTLEVQVALDASQQGEVKRGDPAQITLPGNRSVTGRVDRLGRVAQIPAGDNPQAGGATIPAYIRLDMPGKARELDMAPVQVDVTTKGVNSALSVPVTALVGRSGGGFAVEVVRSGGRRELVGVTLGLFDTTAGRVQVGGDLHEGDRVVVASS